MTEITNHIYRILQLYNIPVNALTDCSNYYNRAGKTDAEKLKQLLFQKFNINIRNKDAQELEILFLTYQYFAKLHMARSAVNVSI